jgi:two-component system phosphate regulon sensor histidine kinase PhoR
MSGPESLEFLSFRRTFTLLIVLVVLPSAGLTGMGIVAIINERAAVEKRLEAAWNARLATVMAELRGAFEAATLEAETPDLVVSTRGLRLTDTGFRLEYGKLTSTEPRLASALANLGGALVELPPRPVVFSFENGQSTAMVAALRRGDLVLGARVSPQAISMLLTRAAEKAVPPGEKAHFALEPIRREVAEGVMARFMSGVSGTGESSFDARELASATMPPPLQDFRLIAYADGGDPVEQASTRNRWLYGILLALFYGTLVVGVVFTGRTLYREAKLSRLKTDFVSLVSHELRTPLTSIRMFIEMLALNRVKDADEAQQVLNLLSKETERLSGLIESVLDWARIESGRKTYDLQAGDVQPVVAQAVAAFRAQRVGVPLDLNISVEPGLPLVRVDREVLAGALLNLLQNAFKYSEGGDRSIALRVLGDAGGVVVEVEDHGTGIPRRELKRVFERFYRIDNLLTRHTEGSGLGLSITQRIVQAHGGRMTVDSVVGKGSTFRIHLPASEP